MATPFDGLTPEQVKWQRRFGGDLMQQGTDASPVGHWTQGLARVLQGGVGGYMTSRADQGEREGRGSGNQLIAQALAGGDLKSSVGSMLSHPWAAEQGGKIAQSMIGQRIEDSSPAAQARLKSMQGAEARASAMHPLQIQEAQLGIQTKQRELDSPAQKLNILPEGATLVGTNMRTGDHQVIAQGAPKIDPTTRKEIVEADDMVSQTRGAISALQQALALNDKAYSGWGASTRAGIVNNTTGLIAGGKDALATTEMENLITNQALQSLRATFGGNPTEGERKVLLEVQGSVGQPKEVRKRILQNAMQMAETRLRYNMERSQGMRSGEYFKQGGQPGVLQQPYPNAPQTPAAGAVPAGSYQWTPDGGLKPMGR